MSINTYNGLTFSIIAVQRCYRYLPTKGFRPESWSLVDTFITSIFEGSLCVLVCVEDKTFRNGSLNNKFKLVKKCVNFKFNSWFSNLCSGNIKCGVPCWTENMLFLNTTKAYGNFTEKMLTLPCVLTQLYIWFFVH